jgi:hypothetical protein
MLRILLSFHILILSLPLLYAQNSIRTGHDYAVLFYVTAYHNNFDSLPETKEETIQIQEELQTDFGFICKAYANLTRRAILDTIATWNKRIAESDQVLFFFSMHGIYDIQSKIGYLIPADGEQPKDDDYGNSWLSYEELGKYLGHCKAMHLMLALDACYSGAFGDRNRSGTNNFKADSMPGGPAYISTEDCQTLLLNSLKYKARQYCTSGNQSAKTPASSLFASKFLECLRMGGHNGVVTMPDLESYFNVSSGIQ